MAPLPPSALLDLPLFPAARYAEIADRIGRLLATTADVLPIQAEAVLALEAIAASVARPGLKAVNVVTSPYGLGFGAWLRRGGVEVTDVVADAGQPVTIDAVRQALAATPDADLLALVHGEAANGALNPLEEIVGLAKARDLLVIVDAVASVGAHPLPIDELGLDIVALGPQKALAGPTGLSAVTVSARAWRHIAQTPQPAPSILSLADLKQNWLDKGRGALPGTPPPLEFWALDAALARVEAEGFASLIARHQQATAATRSAVRALGATLWITNDRSASALVTSVTVPPAIDAEALIAAAAEFGVTLGRGFGSIEGHLVRLDHSGQRATLPTVLANVVGLGVALQRLGQTVNIGAAAEAVVRAYAASA
ncbi:pyridoxal-phosphate-dependent aminotransferase family protein [Oryzibacter oryziterrae]|uniref:pyridoxal-phosphate-dependent aminotransferase family protein n=1 Tax=Oryzibacter oryziterrae TaxID=2766474 RepID=UPI001F20CF3E|nr:aminotransferase class V-fold PLP-dependent enzyme [Oryzibacter oryziterrae]